MTIIATRLHRGQAGGLALVQKYGGEHMKAIGQLGGRPQASTIEDIISSTALAGKTKGKEIRHEKSLKKLLGRWNIKSKAAGGKLGLGLAIPNTSPSREAL